MSNSAGDSIDDSRRLAAVVTAGALLRLPLLFVVFRNPDLARQNDDYLKFGSEWLVTGRYTAEWFPPLYPLLCGKAEWLAGEAAVQLITLVQAILGLGSALLLHRIARNIGLGRGPALAAAAIMAFDPSVVQFGALISSETLFNFLVLGAILAAVPPVNGVPGSAGSPFGAGLFMGFALLTRSIGILLIPVFVGIFLWRRAFSAAGLFAVTVLLAVLPWMMRNHSEHGRFALSPSGAYNFAALMGAPAKAALEGTDRITALREWESAIPRSTRANPFEHGEALSRIAKQWISEHPVPFFKALVRGISNLFFGSDWSGLGPWLFGTAWGTVRMPFLLLILAWRILTLTAALLAMPYSFLRCSRGVSVSGCWIAVIILALAVGAGGYSRFLLPIIPFIALAAGIFFELRTPLKEEPT